MQFSDVGRSGWSSQCRWNPLTGRRALVALIALRTSVCPLPASAASLETDTIPTLSPWDSTVNVRSWAGYKDNVLLGNVVKEDSPFIGAGLDLVILRLPTSGTEFSLFASGEYVHFSAAPSADMEELLMAQSQVKQDLGDAWTASMSVDYLYFDQIFDASALDREAAIVRAQGHSLGTKLGLRKDLANGYWFSVEAGGSRQQFKEFLDDYWEGGPVFTVTRDFNYKSGVGLSYEFRKRSHDTRSPRDLEGRLLEGTLEFYRHELMLDWRQHWGKAHRWRTVTKLGFERNFDNGSGYYDHFRPMLAEQIRYRAPTWELKAEIKVSRYDYDLQPVSDTDPAVRQKTGLAFTLRGEKELWKHVKLFSEFGHERSISNLATDEYTVNTGFAGIDLEF